MIPLKKPGFSVKMLANTLLFLSEIGVIWENTLKKPGFWLIFTHK